jgi:hypothetical protein
VKPEDLNAEQRRVYDTWRALDMSEATAMAQLRNDGLLADADGDHVAFYKRLGLSEAGARVAAAGRASTVGPRLTGSNVAALSEALGAYGRAWVAHYGARPEEAQGLAKAAGKRIWESTTGADAAREAATVAQLLYEARVLVFSADKPWPRAPAGVKPPGRRKSGR